MRVADQLRNLRREHRVMVAEAVLIHGQTYRQCAKKFKVSIGTVHNWINSAVASEAGRHLIIAAEARAKTRPARPA